MKNFTLCLLFILLITTISYAQEEERDSMKYETEELVITGTRTLEKIIDIPFSVFRVDKKELMFGKKVSAKNVLADVPGLFLQSRYGNKDIRVTIRGYGTRSNTGVRGVKILQDGIPESEPDGETVVDAIDFTSLGGVEVVKGNLSSIYGNSPGGVVNFLTDIYFPDNYFTSNNQYGSYGFLQNGGKVGVKTNDYRFFMSYNYRNLKGFRDHSSEYGHLVNSVFEGYLGNKSSITVLSNYVRGINRIPGALTREQFDQNPMQARDIAISQDFRNESKKGRLAVKFKTTFGKNDANELEITGYGGMKDFMKTDDEFYTISTRNSLGSFVRFTNRAKVKDRNNMVTVGMDFSTQSGPRTVYDNINGNKGLTVVDQFEDLQSSIGFYLEDQFEIIKNKSNLFFSSRYDRVSLSKNSLQFHGYTDTSRIFDNFTPKLGLNYKLTPYIALYTSYGIGVDIPAVSELDNNYTTSNTKYTLNPDLKPQNSQNFELGIKGNILNRNSEFMRKIKFEATFFDYVVRNEIVPFTINQNTFFRNATRTNRLGVEVGFMCEPFEGIELVTNYTLTNFKYEDYSAVIQGPSGNTTENYNGNYVPSIPRHILNLIFNYEFEISDKVNGLLQWDCDYLTSMYVNDNNSESTPSYFYGNVMGGINFTVGKFNTVFYAGINNIFDKRYVGYVNINDFYGRYYETGEPRSIYSGLNVSYKF
ncbi:MAG: TonB-dependent receptor [Ignavibacteriae bacterium]|nr:TonB-dependent receptor [Ignavibacteriota bacterium]